VSDEWQYGPPPPAPPQPVVSFDTGSITGLAWGNAGAVYGIKNAKLMPVTAEEIRDVLSHVEVIETHEVDLVCSPGQMWVVEKKPRPITMEFEATLTEEQFWKVVDLVCGPEMAADIRRDVDDILRWEGEGGPCLS
jgi:hypothetical protein